MWQDHVPHGFVLQSDWLLKILRGNGWQKMHENATRPLSRFFGWGLGTRLGFSSFLAYSVGVMKLCTARPELANFAGFFRWVTVDSSRSSKYALRTSLEAFAAISLLLIDWIEFGECYCSIILPLLVVGKLGRGMKICWMLVCPPSEDTISGICKLCQADSFVIASVRCRRHCMWTLMTRNASGTTNASWVTLAHIGLNVAH